MDTNVDDFDPPEVTHAEGPPPERAEPEGTSETPESAPLVDTPSGPAVPEAPVAVGLPEIEQQPLTPELQTLVGILDGRLDWAQALMSEPLLRDARRALRICFRYHPDNTGSDPKSPKRSADDLPSMREDALHLAAINSRLAVISGGLMAGEKAADGERRAARSRAWRDISLKMRHGEFGPGKFTVKDLEHYAEASVSSYYRAETRLRIKGQILSWVRKSVAEMVDTLRMIVMTSSRAERDEARLH